MSHRGSLLGKAIGLRPGQVVVVRHLSDGSIVVSGANEYAKEIIADNVGYDALGRLRIDPRSDLRRTGAQFKLRPEYEELA